MKNFDEYILHRPPVNASADGAPICYLLHGRFADASTIFSVEHLLPSSMHIAAIRAPYPMDETHFQWFTPYDMTHPVDSFSDQQYSKSLEWTADVIRRLAVKYHVDSERQFALGFSQGGAMCYLLGLTDVVDLRGTVPMSGFFPRPIEKLNSINRSTKYLITHGKNDEVLSTEEAMYAHRWLLNQNITAEYYEYNGRHKMTLPLMKYVTHWLEENS